MAVAVIAPADRLQHPVKAYAISHWNQKLPQLDDLTRQSGEKRANHGEEAQDKKCDNAACKMKSRRFLGFTSVLNRWEVVDVRAVSFDWRQVKFNWNCTKNHRLKFSHETLMRETWIRQRSMTMRITQIERLKHCRFYTRSADISRDFRVLSPTWRWRNQNEMKVIHTWLRMWCCFFQSLENSSGSAAKMIIKTFDVKTKSFEQKKI